ncbi:hypothetical protein [Ferrimonas marina]|uniref:Uncharacterized protein n=1 Tax=Ferrimonas marina TaxID=299255 RepID=A0A1M5TTL5_9GAMM|nr:hypothetical protein [Ferrimonas marina]SHH53980.1 hypothetical protein SAMN02745129_2270 [Ferrimonas marina]
MGKYDSHLIPQLDLTHKQISANARQAIKSVLDQDLKNPDKLQRFLSVLLGYDNKHLYLQALRAPNPAQEAESVSDAPHTSLICDTCGEPILSPSDGMLEWKCVDSRCTGLRVVHSRPASPFVNDWQDQDEWGNYGCQYSQSTIWEKEKGTLCDMHLYRFFGADGIQTLKELKHSGLGEDELNTMLFRLHGFGDSRAHQTKVNPIRHVRMNMNNNPTTEQLASLIADCDDTAGNHCLWVERNGTVHITRLDSDTFSGRGLEEITPEMLIRAPVFHVGHGDTGTDAAKETGYVNAWLRRLEEAWEAQLPSSRCLYID